MNGGEKMKETVKGAGIVCIVLAFLVPLAYHIWSLFTLSPSSFSGEAEIEKIKALRTLLWMVSLPSGFILGLFWLTMAEILEKLDQLKPPELQKAEKLEELNEKLPKLPEF